MIVKSLELSNYRNYYTLSMQFSGHTNILYGDNAQGKTNILEAVYLCSTTKSHRGSKDKEMIRIDAEESHIRMILEKNGIQRRLDMHLKKNQAKGAAVDGVPLKKSTELFGLAHMVFFSPEDLSIVKRGPSERRRFLDMELCQLDKLYMHNLICYNKVLNQRNTLLKQISTNRTLLDTIGIWDEQLARYGGQIIKRREKFVHALNDIVANVHDRLTAGKEKLSVQYDKNVEADYFLEKIGNHLEKDLKNKTTETGPHRDDLIFHIAGLDIKKYGSQGQQRTAALSLKLAEIELVEEAIQDMPVLLLDDVLSELDRNRQKQLLDHLQNIQTIITCTGIEEFIKDRIQVDRTYHIINGTVFEDAVQPGGNL